MAAKPLPSPEVLSQLLRYEPETGKLFWRERPLSMFPDPGRGRQWNSRCAGKEALCSNHGKDGYLCGKLLGHVYLAHRIAWVIVNGRWPKHEIDHIDGDRTNNRTSNLREANDAQTAMNTGARRGGTSEYVGVHFDKRIGRWRAVVQRNRKRLHLGTFASEIDAAATRDAAARVMHGDFARLNLTRKEREAAKEPSQ